jgi:hypothetical protein
MGNRRVLDNSNLLNGDSGQKLVALPRYRFAVGAVLHGLRDKGLGRASGETLANETGNHIAP